MDFTGSTPIDLPGLVNGNILAMKLGKEDPFYNNYWAIMSVERAVTLNGDLTYFGNCLLYVIGDKQLVWKKMVSAYDGELVTMGQLNKVPLNPYYRKIRMEPIPDGPANNVLQEVSGLLLLNADWDPQNKYILTFRGDWCPLFRNAAASAPQIPGAGGGFNNGQGGSTSGGFNGIFG